LTGSGKAHKYVEIKSERDIQNPAIKKLLEEGLRAYNMRVKEK
jgi:hypothetical protein